MKKTLFEMASADLPVISREIISPQDNDWFVDKLIQLFQAMIDDANTFKPKHYLDYISITPFKNTIEAIESIIKKRFGINAKIIGEEYGFFSVITSPPPVSNAINKYADWSYSEIKDYLTKLKEEGLDSEKKALKDIYDLNTQIVSILKYKKKAIDELNDRLKVGTVNIDNSNAVITGLPDDYIVFFAINFDTAINKAGLSAEEMAAAFIHEIGHAYTHIEYTYRTTYNTTVLIDTMHDSIVKRGDNINNTIALTYKNLGGEEDISKSNSIIASIKLFNQFNNANRSMDDTNHSAIDSEQLADQFAARFGMSSYLTTALERTHKYFGGNIDYITARNVFNISIGLLIAIYVLYIPIMLGILASGSFLTTIGIGGIAIIMIMRGILSIAMGEAILNDKTYDVDKRRYQRIRNDVIRQLRTRKYNKEYTEMITAKLKIIDEVIAGASDEYFVNDKVLKRISLFLSKNVRRNVKLQETNELVEDLMENELHLVSSKIKTLK